MKVNAQNIKNYDADWKTVSQSIEKGLPASALDIVKKIYAKAKTDRQDAQIVKSLVYMTQLQEENRENNQIISISEIEKEIGNSKEPATSLLNSYLAGQYQQYFAINRYQLYGRTNTVDLKKNDIATWTAADFTKKISDLYLASIADKKKLQQTSLAAYEALITKGNVRFLRPTLYDLLAHRALDYFKSDERDITKPSYAFEMNQPEAFSTAATFAKANFTTKDSLSLQYKALLIFQELIAFHLNDSKPDALIDVDLERLQYVQQKSILPNKETLYYNALEAIAQKYNDNPTAAQALYLMAAWHTQKGESTNNNDSLTNDHLLKAKTITEKIISQKEESEGKVNAYNLQKQLLQPDLNFQIEKVNVPNLPFRMLVNYKNAPVIYMRIIKATEALKGAMKDYSGKQTYWALLAKASPVKEWKQDLPGTADLRQHSTELKIDALSAGEYFVFVSYNSTFSQTNNILATQLTYISNISYITSKNDVFVQDRVSGQPLGNAKVAVWQTEYDYNTSKNQKAKFADYITDKNGFFTVVKEKSTTAKRNASNNFIFDITHGGERFFMDDINSNYHYYNDYAVPATKTTTNIFFFTDRSLYRPGQTVYFKGIAITRNSDGKKAEILANYKTTVTLLDANRQKVDSIKVSTNEYGSFNGTFILPQGGLNGNFTISASKNTGTASFRMEEYKRPKFYVDFEKLKGTYKLNEQITATGIAKAYAGNNIDGATVTYRVVREARFPYPWLFRGWWPRNDPPQEITHGTTTTKADGSFNISFQAMPDASIDPKLDPVFDYRIYADVADINGEVRSGNERITVGYKSLLLSANIPDRIAADSLKQLSISTTNMAGNFEKATVQVSFTKLKPEERLLRSRYWQKPDQFVMNKEEYIKYFPHDIYKDENEPQSWAKGETVLQQTGDTDSTGILSLNKNNIEPGYYIVNITTHDKEGKEIKDQQYVEVYKEKQQSPAYPQYLWAVAPRPIEPGEKTNIEIGSSAKNIFLVQAVNKPETKYSFQKLDNETKTFRFEATEADRGGYGVTYVFVKDNRVYQSANTIAVPWTNKDLKIEYATFRDKTLPGAEEKWSVTLSGYKGEKVAAEMLASMYDASLDLYYPHQWNKPGLWYNYYNATAWDGSNNFSAVSSIARPYFTNDDYKSYEKNYDWIFGQHNIFRQLSGRVGGLQIRGIPSPVSREAMDQSAVAGMDVKLQKIELNYNVANKASAVEKPESDTANQDEASNVQQTTAPQIRKNFNETAFFFPDLKTDKDGNISFSFTMPEALTRWKFQAMSHTKDLAIGYSSKEIVTQKDLMVQPNAPRFLREGDKMEFSSKIVNLSAKEITGIATFELLDAATNEPIDGWFKNIVPQQYFTIAAGQSQAVKFPIEIPYQFSKAVTWRIVAKTTSKNTEALSDGEENMLPVLTNRMLVTESLPLQMRGFGTKNYKFEKLLNSGNSETISTQTLTVEYTSNPAWYAVQALPYMMEYPYDCAEQTWNRYYANSLATLAANSSPKIKQIFDSWKNKDTAALMSNLQKNQELKAVLLEETPWVLQAQSEAQQKKNIAVLFDLVRMSGELNKAYDKLKQMQSPNGGFVWFKGGPDDRFMTQYIITGIGHLQKLNAISPSQTDRLSNVLSKALPYLDQKIKTAYDELIKSKASLGTYQPDYYEVQYLYMRSFFPQTAIAANAQKAVNYFTDRAGKTWVHQNKYMQGMIALALHRKGEIAIPNAILKSLKETAINNEEMGMYYKDAVHSWWWYEAPIERQALIIEAFEEIAKDKKTADDLRTWLLKNKQTNNWESTKATAEACYALLLQGTQWLTVSPEVVIDLGGLKIASQLEKTEAGTGYMKKLIPGEKVKPSMGNISVMITKAPGATGPESLPTWGSVYWQYFEDLDKITTASTPLQLSKKLFIETNGDRGPVLTPIAEGGTIKVGDKIKVRVELKADRDMEYVHMKDMRASGFEPVNVLSSYKWQGGLGYYETTKDASTNFFFDYLRKGTYVFEYTLFATVAGNFSNGITTIQCMYAPEFSSHSEGIRVMIQ